jgi:Glycosyl hydrolase family 9
MIKQHIFPASSYVLLAICFSHFSAHICFGIDRPNYAPNYSFENETKELFSWIPLGVVPENGPRGIKITDKQKRTGSYSLKVTPDPYSTIQGTLQLPDHNGGETTKKNVTGKGVKGVRTFGIRLDHDIESVSASLWIKKDKNQSIRFSLLWTNRDHRKAANPVRLDTSKNSNKQVNDWLLYSLNVKCPENAHHLQLQVETDSPENFYIDDVQLDIIRKSHCDLLVNQVGYQPESASNFAVLQSTRLLKKISPAELVHLKTGQKTKLKPWVNLGYLKAWDLYHWKVDLSDIVSEGKYKIVCKTDMGTVESPPIQIGNDLIVKSTAELSIKFFYYQRCGMEIPGFHKACHLDDAKMPDGSHRDLSGGWHDAGDYNKYNGYTPESMFALVWAYHQKPDLYKRWDRDKDGLPDILDESAWGAQFLEKCFDKKNLQMINSIFSGYGYWGTPDKETDQKKANGDERPVKPGQGSPVWCISGFAYLGHYLKQSGVPKHVRQGEKWILLARRLYEKYGGGIEQILPLYVATRDKSYLKKMENRVQKLLKAQKNQSTGGFRELAIYTLSFPENQWKKQIEASAKRRVQELRQKCDSRFQVVMTHDLTGKPAYFRGYRKVSDWYVGETQYRLDHAIDGLLASHLGEPKGRTIAENQIHWLLGRNPLGVSMIEGTGTNPVPYYHHRYNAIPGNPRGAVPGALINGLIRAWPEHDRPWLDMRKADIPCYHSNEPWLPHNNRWLMVLGLL